MIDAPRVIDGATVLQVASLEGTVATGATRHVVRGDEADDFAFLAITQYHGDAGVYLHYCDPDWGVITDTFHESVEDAVAQAEFEFVSVTFHPAGADSGP